MSRRPFGRDRSCCCNSEGSPEASSFISLCFLKVHSFISLYRFLIFVCLMKIASGLKHSSLTDLIFFFSFQFEKIIAFSLLTPFLLVC